jgi:plasmid stability protein
MASITIRNLEPATKNRLRLRAARHGRSMEEEARQILRGALADTTSEVVNLYDLIRRTIEPLGGVELEIPARDPMREPPAFDE